MIFFLQLNLSEIARNYEIPGTNGNMVVKEFLQGEGIDLSKFTTNISSCSRIRRRYEKMPGRLSSNTKNNKNIINVL